VAQKGKKLQGKIKIFFPKEERNMQKAENRGFAERKNFSTKTKKYMIYCS